MVAREPCGIGVKSSKIMSITLHPPIETELRARAKAEGITVEAYLERLLCSEQEVLKDIESIAMEGINSGTPVEVGRAYSEKLPQRLDDRLKRSS
jgi:hypothetical protein